MLWKGSCCHAALTRGALTVPGSAVGASAPIQSHSSGPGAVAQCGEGHGALCLLWVCEKGLLLSASSLHPCGMEPGSHGAAWDWGHQDRGAWQRRGQGQGQLGEDGDAGRAPLPLPQPRELCELTSVRAGACVPRGIPRAQQSGVGEGCAPGSLQRSVQLQRCGLTLWALQRAH